MRSLETQASEVDEHLDKLREECGVMAVYNHPGCGAAYVLGALFAAASRAGIRGDCVGGWEQVRDIKGMGLVSEIFTDDVLAKLPGHLAIGHTRYSTTGDSALLNAQPISVDSTMGLIAIAHNGNLINLGTAKARLERDGAIFQTTSDSEIIVQLIAHSACNTLVDCMADALKQVDGAFSIVLMTRNRHLCGARSARVSPAVHGADCGRRWRAGYVLLCVRDVRAGPAACEV